MRCAAGLMVAMFVVGGCGGGDDEAAWEQAPSLAHGRSAHAIASDGKTVWALGGTDASGMPVLEVERLDGLRVANHAGAENPGSYSVAVRMHTH